MSYYTLRIEYTSNENKAAVGYLIDEKRQIRTDLGHMVLPSEQHEFSDFFVSTGKIKEFIPNDSSEIKKEVRQELNYFGDSGLIFSSRKGGKSLKILSTLDKEGDVLIGTSDQSYIISVSERTLTILQDIVRRGSDLVLEGKRKWFKFGLPEVKRQSFYSYQNFMNKVEEMEDSIKRRELKKFESESEIPFELAGFVKPSVKISGGSGVKKENINSQKRPETKPKNNNNKIIYTNDGVRNLNSSNNISKVNTSSQGINAFDILYMNAFPELAPFHRPDSLMAWMIWLNNLNKESGDYKSIEYPKIEGVSDYKLRDIGSDSNKSYEIQLYSENGSEMGKVLYTEDGGLKVLDLNGNKTLMKANDDGSYSVETKSVDGSNARMSLSEENGYSSVSDYVISPKNGLEISSTNDTAPAVPTVDAENVNRNEINYNLGESKTYEVEDKYEPPPPPPPPPDVTFSSNDPYSYSSSSGPSF